MTTKGCAERKGQYLGLCMPPTAPLVNIMKGLKTENPLFCKSSSMRSFGRVGICLSESNNVSLVDIINYLEIDHFLSYERRSIHFAFFRGRFAGGCIDSGNTKAMLQASLSWERCT